MFTCTPSGKMKKKRTSYTNKKTESYKFSSRLRWRSRPSCLRSFSSRRFTLFSLDFCECLSKFKFVFWRQDDCMEQQIKLFLVLTPQSRSEIILKICESKSLLPMHSSLKLWSYTSPSCSLSQNKCDHLKTLWSQNSLVRHSSLLTGWRLKISRCIFGQEMRPENFL